MLYSVPWNVESSEPFQSGENLEMSLLNWGFTDEEQLPLPSTLPWVNYLEQYHAVQYTEQCLDVKESSQVSSI